MCRAELLEVISQEIDRISALPFRSFHFPVPLERHYENLTRHLRCRRLWFEGILAIVLFNAYLLCDFSLNGCAGTRSLAFRILLLTPLAVAVNISLRFNPTPFVREASVALVTCVAGATELLNEANRCAVRSAYAQFAVTAVLIFSNTVMRLRLPYALTASIAIFALDLQFLLQDHFLARDQKFVGIFLNGCMVLLSLLANYSQQREERLNFLLCRRDELLLLNTRDLNAQLERVADTDALTGLANRSAFNRAMERLWTSTGGHDCHLSIVLFDVDRFKSVNDTFGHIYGDDVLRTVTRALKSGVRSGNDLLARYGGEEFVLLMPETDQEEALHVAERLRELVTRAQLPIPGPGLDRPLSATVSCGVASANLAELSSPKLLLDLADKALYKAKQQGRNRVCHSALLESTPDPLPLQDWPIAVPT